MYIWTGYTINAIKEESVRVLADNMVYTGEEAISEPRWGEDRLTVSVVKAQRASGRSCASSIGQADYKTASTVDSNISHSTMFPTPSSQQRHAGFSSSRSPQATHCAGRAAGRRTAVQKLCSFRGSRLMSSYYLQVAVFVLALTLQCSSSLRTSGSKEPLITTDAAQGDDFRTFMQSSSSDDDEVPTGRHAAADNMADDAGTLDFQSLKVIERWGNTTNILLVAGRDYVYMLDSRYSAGQPKKINYLERLTWRTPTKSQRECQLMGKKEYECQNFIRVVEVLEDDRLMVCGTNAYSPACRFYERHQFNDPSDSGSSFQSESTCQAQCVVPFNPATASATLYTETDSGYQIFAAVVNDFLGDEPTILRKETPTLFSNSHWLNEPTFLKILEYGDKVYVFFREVAKDSESDGDDDSTYARVAQMCKNDQGGVNVLAQQWTSFLKARLRCGHQGRGHLQFNNMTSVSDVVQYRDENGLLDDVIFATFSTPREWTDVSLSAVCAFSMRDIIEVFETGSFLGEIELDAKPKQKPNLPHMGGPSFSAQNSVKKVMSSYAVPRNEVPNPRPGSCRKVQTYPNVLYFAKEHPLMYDTIGPKFQAPIFVTFNGVKATQIAVDSNAGDDGHLMLYLGTEDGDVLRLRGMLSATKGPKAVFLESISAVEDKESCDNDTCVVRSLHVSRTSDRAGSTPSAFVAFSGHMVQFPLMRCALYQTSQCCSVDPGCGWTSQGKCVQRTRSNRYSLVPTTKAGSDLPKTCDVTSGKSNESEGEPLASAGTSSVGTYVALFIGGILVGVLLTIILFVGCGRLRRRGRKHTGGCLGLIINKPVHGKSIARIESSNNRADGVSEAAAAARPAYLDMSKEPEPQTRKYSLPPSPSPSDGGHDVGFAGQQTGRMSLKDEEMPLVVEIPDSPARSVEAVPPIPAKKAQKLPEKVTPDKKEPAEDGTASNGNPNSNNSNNYSFGIKMPEPSPPALPVKESAVKLAPTPLAYISPSRFPAQPADDIHAFPGKQPSPIKKHQSFGGYDRSMKPPVPNKSPALIKTLAARRPHSLAPPKSVNKIEDITIPPRPQVQHSQTPPIVRSYHHVPQQQGFSPPAPNIIPKRRERPPSFRHNSMAQKESRSPVPVSAPVVPDSDARIFK